MMWYRNSLTSDNPLFCTLCGTPLVTTPGLLPDHYDVETGAAVYVDKRYCITHPVNNYCWRTNRYVPR